MRKILFLTLVLCVAAAFAYAQAPAAAPATTGTAATTGTTTGTTGATTGGHKHKAAASKKYKGEVTSVDATAKSFVVKEAKGDLTLKVNDKTKYSKGKSWADVAVGGKVWGAYKNDGTDNWALSVYWAKEKHAAAAPKAPKTGK